MVIECVFVSLVGFLFLLDATVANCKYFHVFRTRLTTVNFENSKCELQTNDEEGTEKQIDDLKELKEAVS